MLPLLFFSTVHINQRNVKEAHTSQAGISKLFTKSVIVKRMENTEMWPAKLLKENKAVLPSQQGYLRLETTL